MTLPSGKATDDVVEALGCGGRPNCTQRPDTVGVRVRGRLVIDGPAGQQPLAFVRLTLQRRGSVVATASSDRSGAFVFSRNLEHGAYDLVVESDRYEGAMAVDLNLRSPEVLLVGKRRTVAAP